MRLSSIAVFVAAGMAVGGMAASVALAPKNGLNDEQVRAVVSEMLAEPVAEATQEDVPTLEQRMSVGSLDRATLDPMFESFLMANPRILQRMSDALQTELRVEEQETTRLALAAFEEEIYNDPDHVVLGNPDGDVTLVEMFDYNCPYCRTAMPDLAELIDTDPDLRVILKEFPILSEGSMEAARIGVVVNQSKGDYWAYHEALFTGTGQINGEVAAAAAEKLGFSPVSIQLEASSEAVAEVIGRSFEIARGLNISGTPAYIIGNEIVPGAVGLEALRQRIANVRACGETVCEN